VLAVSVMVRNRNFCAKGTFAPRHESSSVPGLGLGLRLGLCSLVRKFTGKKVLRRESSVNRETNVHVSLVFTKSVVYKFGHVAVVSYHMRTLCQLSVIKSLYTESCGFQCEKVINLKHKK